MGPTGVNLHVLGEDGTDAMVVLPGGPLADPRYMWDLGGLGDLQRLAVLELPWRRADDLVDVVDQARQDLRLQSVELLAHSAAAAVALAYLAAHPDRVRRLVLVTPAVSAVGVPPDQHGVQSVLEQRASDDEGFARALEAERSEPGSLAAQRIFFGRWDERAEQVARHTLPDRQERLSAYYAEPRPDADRLRSAAAGFAGRVTIVHGELDLHPTPRQALDLAELFTQAPVHVVRVEGAGHYPWLDDPGAFVAAVAHSSG